MPKKCCIKGCGMKYDKASGISLHKFPQNEELCQKWLERIGFENMNPELKVPKVCSRHFPESDFNRTLGVIRLRDDVVPSIHLVPSKKTHEPALYEIETVNEDAVSTSSIESQPTLPVEHIYIRSEKVQHQPSNLQKNERIQEICIKQRKEIKKLRQRIRRQDQKILKMENIINDLKKRGIIIISLD
ncbi:THAP domain-containing protein 1-like isoform X2 [Spodoptera litura]|uniref:THAP domain-containing protein 1-like isoform X2 n=1 Tax=Spodoptera litura TaxID=69820 RepID=A0A9J7IQF9_SPOLT|nr:THAP domain-containing protein 1-like isoform X2 [Spodoptera litura]